MAFRNKAQLLDAAKESKPPAPVRAIRPAAIDEYIQAFRKLELVITEKQRSMLIAHALAPGHALTMSELASLVGFPNYSAANLQYGLLGKKLAEKLGIPRPSFLVYVIARFDDDPSTSHSRAHMYPELVAALEQLGWVETDRDKDNAVGVFSEKTAVNRPASYEVLDGMLTIQQVITTLEQQGFTRPVQSGLKVIRLEHPSLPAPLFVKQSSSIHARLQAPLVLHPDYEQRIPDLLGVAGIERGNARYYHNSNLRGFPKRRNGGANDIAYGVDIGFRHVAALEELLSLLLGAQPHSESAVVSHASLSSQGDFDLQDLAVTDTERDALIKARVGQSGYRDELLGYWGGCAVTDCCAPMLLRASHIKPWRVASGAERLDPFNGLLLTPNLDLAFDQGLISFDDHGQILLGEDLDPDSARALNITSDLRLRQIDARHREYLAWHRDNLFRK